MRGISLRTYQRWTQEDSHDKTDGRKASQRTAPDNKLSEDERRQILMLADSAKLPTARLA